MISLYKNVYLNNPEHDFIFQNPTLILNYIFIDITSGGENNKKEEHDLILRQKLEEENEANLIVSKKSRKISNSDIIRSDDSFKLSYKNSLKNNNYLEKKSNKNLKDIFNEKGQLIISSFFENMQEKNENLESSTESEKSIEYSFNHIKFEENDLIIISKVIDILYPIEKKKKESSMKKLK